MYNKDMSGQFSIQMVSCNNLDDEGFIEWLFSPAMLFGSHDKWWGGTGGWDTPHEGLDICRYRTSDGAIGYLGAGALVPVIYEGRIVHVIDDFLGKSVFVVHDKESRDGDRLFTIYSHITPRNCVRPGKTLNAGDYVGTIADPLSKGRTVRPHLHISAARITDTVTPGELDWSTINGNTGVTLVNPLGILDLPYSILEE